MRGTTILAFLLGAGLGVLGASLFGSPDSSAGDAVEEGEGREEARGDAPGLRPFAREYQRRPEGPEDCLIVGDPLFELFI